jgi:hypothetical protein
MSEPARRLRRRLEFGRRLARGSAAGAWARAAGDHGAGGRQHDRLGHLRGAGGQSAELAGPLGLVAWAINTAGYLCLTAVFADLGGAYPVSGGLQAFARRAFGDFAALEVGYLYWMCAVIGNAAFLTGSSPTWRCCGRGRASRGWRSRSARRCCGR